MTRRLSLAGLVVTFVALAAPALAQLQPRTGPTLPATCNPLAVQNTYQKTGTDAGLYRCTAVNTWTRVVAPPLQPFRWPSSDGTSGQCLQTDGAGVLSFGDCSGGGASALSGLSDVTLSSPVTHDVLTYDGSKWVNTEGSSLPSTVGHSGGSLVLTYPGGSSQPTVAAAIAAQPGLLFTWAATSDPAYADDVVVFTHGGSSVFVAEAFLSELTGGTEPDWDVDAPNPGDSISDGDVTWYNAGPWSAWPPTPTTWQADHDYSDPSPQFIWPTVPNGHLYVAYPGYFGTSGSSEPTFTTSFGTYASDGDGYWQDVGGQMYVPTWSDLVNPIITGVVTQTAAPVVETSGGWFAYSLSATSDSGLADFPHTAFFTLMADGGGITQKAYGLEINAYKTGTHDLDFLASLYLNSGNQASGGTIAEDVGLWIAGPPTASPITTHYGIFDVGSHSATNNYFTWHDSPGVRRDKNDSTFDSVFQSIEALYNPQFTKYTPGATDFERIILGQWNGNVGEIGTEKGGTGTLRDLRLIGDHIQLPLAGCPMGQTAPLSIDSNKRIVQGPCS